MKKQSKMFFSSRRATLVVAAAAFLMVSVSAGIAPSSARADEPVVSSLVARKGFWALVHDFVVKCAVMPTDNKGVLVSVCPELVVRGNTAQFTLEGEDFSATLTDSQYSDGGDLNDVTVSDVHGKVVAVREYVAAYGDILLALAGGDDSFRPAN